MKKSYYLAPVAVLATVAAVVTAQLPRTDGPRTPELPPVAAGPAAEVPIAASTPLQPTPSKLPTVPPPTAAPTPTFPGTPTLPGTPTFPGKPTLPSTPKLPPVPSPLATNPAVPQATAPHPRPLPNVPPPTTVAGPTTPPATTQTLSTTRQFVVLKDDKLIEGEVSQSEEKVVVRQGAFDRPFPKKDVQFVGGTKDDVYRFMAGKTAAADPLARLKVAKWCMYNGMRSQALAEAREVVKLDPKNSSATLMVRALEESLQKYPEDGTPATAAPTPNAPVTNPTGPTLPQVPPPMAKEPPPIPPAVPSPIPPAIPAPIVNETDTGLAPDATAMFATRVQPILANLCAECHAKADHASAFKLARTTAYDSSSDTTVPNLKAVAGQLNKADPAKSPLLVKAVTAHGGMKQPLFAGRTPAAYRNLEAWVYAAIGSATPPPAAPEPVAKVNQPPAETPSAPSPLPPTASTGAFGQEAKPLPPPGPDPRNTGDPVDEFDPSVFNRSVSPRR